jgi:hypothetical protein
MISRVTLIGINFDNRSSARIHRNAITRTMAMKERMILFSRKTVIKDITKLINTETEFAIRIYFSFLKFFRYVFINIDILLA